jgi:hypothetical protein
MDNQHKHKTQHQEQREHEKAEHKQYQLDQEKKPRVIHPAWFFILGAILIVTVVTIWTLM